MKIAIACITWTLYTLTLQEAFFVVSMIFFNSSLKKRKETNALKILSYSRKISSHKIKNRLMKHISVGRFCLHI